MDDRDILGRTALMYASSGPNVETVDLLLESGADPHAKDSFEGFTPLMFASTEGQLEVVRSLLGYGADPGVLDADGESAIDFAKTNGHAQVVEALTAPSEP